MPGARSSDAARGYQAAGFRRHQRHLSLEGSRARPARRIIAARCPDRRRQYRGCPRWQIDRPRHRRVRFRASRHRTGRRSSHGAVAVIGAGGVGKAIAFALAGLGVPELRIYDSDPAKAAQLAARLYGQHTASVTDNVEDALRGVVGVVNASPVGMLPSVGTPVPDALLHAGLWVAGTAVYSPLWTPLLIAARAKGARVMTGRELADLSGRRRFRAVHGADAVHHRDCNRIRRRDGKKIRRQERE